MEVQEYENGHYVLFDYDSLGRTKTVTYTNVDPRPATAETVVSDEIVPYTRTLTYTYTGDGQLHSVTESMDGVTTAMYLYQYDTLGNLIGSEKLAGGAPVLRTYHSYNDDNKLSFQGWQIGSDSFSQTYSYGKWNGNLSTIVLSDNDANTTDTTLNYTYDSLQRVHTVSNGVFTSTYKYHDDTASGKASPRLLCIEHSGVTYGGKTVECNHSYEYDPNGNIVSAAFGAWTNTYVYDDNNQLIRENNDRRKYTQVWDYDAFGNITETRKYAYTTTDQLSNPTSTVTYGYTDSVWGDLLTEYNGQHIDYDSIGNPVSVTDAQGNEVKSYTWTQGRQMSSYTNNGVTWEYTYDANGLRTGRTYSTNTYEYIYAGDKLIRMVYNGTVVDFGYAGGQLATLTYDGTTYYYVLNGQGDVVALTDSTGRAVIAYHYSAYGEATVLRADETLTPILKNLNPFLYRGYVYDIGASYYYLQSRYYDPKMGRFINADAYVSTGQGILGNNMFAYCGNNPVKYSDPTGTTWIDDLLDILRNKLEEEKEESKNKTGTETVGINFAEAFGLAGYVSFGITWDKRGNIGFVMSGGGGAGFPSAGVTFFGTHTNAPSVEKHNGVSAQVGGSVNAFGGCAGAECVFFADSDTGQGYQGTTVFVGFSPIPIGVEMHGEVGTSKVYSVNIYDIALYVIDFLSPQ